jgi:hypothetical protein
MRYAERRLRSSLLCPRLQRFAQPSLTRAETACHAADQNLAHSAGVYRIASARPFLGSSTWEFKPHDTMRRVVA